MRYLSKSHLRNERILIRVDFNVPIQGKKVRDDFRIRKALPTIERLLKSGNSVMLLSHHSDKHQSLKPVKFHLEKLLARNVHFVVNPRMVERNPSRVILFENLRKWKEEEAESKAFARALSRWGTAYVNEAFPVAHRRGASLTVLPRLLPSYLGMHFELELKVLSRLLTSPKRPLVAVFGGAKVGTKLNILRNFIRKSDTLFCGGAIANTLLHLRGFQVGKSPVEKITTLGHTVHSPKIMLPIDVVVRSGKRHRTIPVEGIRNDEIILDIGPRTAKALSAVIQKAAMVIWNGPLGLVEEAPFDRGTRELTHALRRTRAEVILGGGDTVAFLKRRGLIKCFKNISTGGGAMMAYLGGEDLPALRALK